MTPQELQAAKQRLLAQPASGRDVAALKAELLKQQPANTPAPPQKSTLRKVGDFFTSSTQKFADTLGSAAAVATGVTDEINASKLREADAALKLSRIQPTSPDQAARIQSQLTQSPKIGTATEQIPSLMKTNRQVVGEALGTGLEALSGGTLGGLTKAKTLGQAVIGGAKTGGVYGALAGTSQGLQDNKSASGIAKSTLAGGALGGVLGGAIGAAGYGISKIPEAAGRKSEKVYRSVLKMTPPETRNEALQNKNTPALLKKLGITGDLPEVNEKIVNILDDKSDELSKLLAERGKSVTVSTDDFEKAALNSLDKYKTHVAEYGSIKTKLETIIGNTRRLFGDQIPVDVANEIKSALWKDSYNIAGTKVVNDATREAGSSLKNLIELAIPDQDIARMNKEIGELIVAKTQLEKSLPRLQSGKLSSKLGAIIGGMLGLPGGPYAAVGSAALGSQIDKLLLSNVPLRTNLAQLLSRMEGATPAMQRIIQNQIVQLLERHGIMAAGREGSKLMEKTSK